MRIELHTNRFYELCRNRGISLSLFFLFLTAVSYLLLTGSSVGTAKLQEITGGIGILDTVFGYTAEDAQRHFSQLGEAGRTFNLMSIIPLDMLFMVSYTALLLVFTCRIIMVRRKEGSYPRRTRFILAVPAAAGIADFLENLAQAIILYQYPQHPDSLVSLLSFLTPAKFLLFSSALAALVAEIAAAGLRNPEGS